MLGITKEHYQDRVELRIYLSDELVLVKDNWRKEDAKLPQREGYEEEKKGKKQ